MFRSSSAKLLFLIFFQDGGRIGAVKWNELNGIENFDVIEGEFGMTNMTFLSRGIKSFVFFVKFFCQFLRFLIKGLKTVKS